MANGDAHGANDVADDRGGRSAGDRSPRAEGSDHPWRSTDVTAGAAGRYSAVIGPEWMLAVAPQGGVVAAVAARAMKAELAASGSAGSGQVLRSIHGVFASPVPEGPVEIEVEVLRHGRSMSQVQATVRGPGRPAGFTALAVFGAERQGFSFTALTPPEVPHPDECRSFREPIPPEGREAMASVRELPEDWEPFPFWVDVLDGRKALGHDFWDPTPRAHAVEASWYRFEQEPLGADGRLDPYAALVVCDMMPGAVFQRVGPTDRQWFAPSVDLTVHLVGTATPGWLLAHTRAHVADDGYASAESALWDPRGEDGPELVAWATQQMFFTALSD